MKEFLKKLIASKKEQLAKETERMKSSNDVNEVRAIGKTLLALRDEINDAEEQLKALEDAPAEDAPAEEIQDEPKVKDEEGERMNPLASYGLNKRNAPVENTEPRSSMEYRSAFMNYVKTGKKSEVLQYRSDDQNESGDLGVLLPLTVIQEIIKTTEKVYGQLYSRVKKTNVQGGVKYPIGAFSATFSRITENGAPTDRQNAGSITGYVEFTYKLGEVRIAQTLLASVLSVPVFEQELSKTIVEAYVKAMDTEIISGNGTNNQMVGILTEASANPSRISSDNIIGFTSAEMADWKEFQKKLFAKIPLSMRALSPEFVMTANTYEANIKTLVDDNNRPIATETFNPVDGAEIARFKGKEVVFVEEGLGFENFDDADNNEYWGMYWVPEKAYAINSNLEFAVKRYFDEEKLQWVERAVVINDGKVLDPKYIYLLKKTVNG